MTAPLVIWHLGDGKPGHENQALGLIEAMGRQVEISVQRIDLAGIKGIFGRMRAAFRQAAKLPSPDLIIGAGHAVHLPMLVLARRAGRRSVVLMKPSLPHGLFDLCLVPRHDLAGAVPAENVMITVGALNRVQPAEGAVKSGGLILLGGPSASHGWDAQATLAAIGTILATGGLWALTDSRRTPAAMRQEIHARFPALEIFPHEETPGGWLPGQLAAAAEVWVTEDSVSMIYEALSSGAKVGLLPVPRIKAAGRVTRGIDDLVEEGLVTSYASWQLRGELPPHARILREADRCAKLILGRWFPQAE